MNNISYQFADGKNKDNKKNKDNNNKNNDEEGE